MSRRDARAVLAALLAVNAVGLAIVFLIKSQVPDDGMYLLFPIIGQAILGVGLVIGVIVIIRQWRRGWRES